VCLRTTGANLAGKEASRSLRKQEPGLDAQAEMMFGRVCEMFRPSNQSLPEIESSFAPLGCTVFGGFFYALKQRGILFFVAQKRELLAFY
jgi:hypothetical protein